MARWIKLGDQVLDWSDREDDPPEGAVAVDRPPEDREKLVAGRWEPDLEARADHDAGGPEHIAEVHRAKLLEAVVVLSGVELSRGFLAREAQALGVPLVDLARTVYGKARPLVEREVKRRKAKEAARNGD